MPSLSLGLYKAQVNHRHVHFQSGLSGGCCWNPCVVGSVVQLHLSAWFPETSPVNVQFRGQGSRGADTVVSSQMVFSFPNWPEIHFQSFWLLWTFLWYLQHPPPPAQTLVISLSSSQPMAVDLVSSFKEKASKHKSHPLIVPTLKGWRLPTMVVFIYLWLFSTYFKFSSVTQSCLTLCDPMNCSMPDLPVHHQLPESTQTHVHRVGNEIQPSHPLSSPSLPAFNLSQHQGLFKWVISSHQVAKVLEFQLQRQSLQWTPRTDLL